jgi:hypothetical protein
MTLQPALPPLLLAAAGVLITALVLLRRRTGGPLPWGLAIAAVLLLAALARPVLGGSEPAVTGIAGAREPNIFLIVDRSAAMAEYGSAARADIDAVLDRHPDARFALITFDARPSLDWPLSADSWSLRPTLDAATPYARTADDITNVGAAGNVLRYQLISASQQFPQARNLVYYFGAGAPESTAPQREFRLPEGDVDGGAVFGYGDAAEARLRAVADQIGVPYVSDGQDTAPEEAAPQDSQGPQPDHAGAASSGFELYWVLAGVAGLVLLFELYHALRYLRRTRLDRIEVGR